jgi:hypothetical protein
MAILVITLFSQATLVVPGLEAAGVVGNSPRFGVDQDGNLVQLSVPTPAIDSASRTAPTVNTAPSPRAIKYVMDQNGGIREVTHTAMAATPSADRQPAPLETAHVAVPAPVPPVRNSSPPVKPMIAPVTEIARTATPPSSGAQAVSKAPSPGFLSGITSRIKIFLAGAPRGASPALATVTPLRKPAVPSANISSSPTTPRYSLAIDSLKIRSSVRPIEKKLAGSGVAILDTRTEPTSVEIHRLHFATYHSLDEARKRLREVQPKLKQAYIISHNGVHGIYCGSYYQVRKAVEKASQLQSAGVRLTIRHDNVTVNRTTIIAGSYLSRSAARDISLRLRRMGIPATIVDSSETLAELRNKSVLNS